MKWLSGADAVMLYTETPNVHMHTLTAVVIELDKDCRNLDIETFRRAIHERLYKLEPFCYQLVDIPFKFHHPMWREHCEVDLTYHVRPWRLPSPGGRRELDGAIGEIGSTPLDRSRPLWEMYFVEGLADNRVAVVGKIHHALIDGGAARNLFARGMDLQAVPDGGPYPPDPVPTKLRRIRLALAQNVRQAGRIPGAIGYTVGGEVRVRRSSRKRATPQRPFTPPPTFMNHFLAGPERRFASCTLALADVKQTAKHLGVTINDLVLAMSTGALRTLLLRYDGKADPLVALIPVSDLFPDRISGNFSDAMSVTLPVDVEDPLERLRRCHENVICGQGESAAQGTGAAQTLVELRPARGSAGLHPVGIQPQSGGQNAQPEHLERCRSLRTTWPGGRCTDHRIPFGGAAGPVEWAQHHRVELCRYAQYLGADGRCHHGRPT